MKNMMKKILCLVLAVVVAATLCGCNIVSQATGEIVDDVKHEIENAISGVISNEVGGLVSNIVGGIKDEFTGLNGSNNNSSSSSADNTTTSTDESSVNSSIVIDENGTFDQKDDVALYIHEYGKLPSNYISKKDAEALGWSGGSLEKYAPGKCIGGSRFGNYEELLPEKDGRIYTECDIDTLGKSSRGAKRIVFSNDGLIYYTEDHYESFELLYGKDLI